MFLILLKTDVYLIFDPYKIGLKKCTDYRECSRSYSPLLSLCEWVKETHFL